MLFEKLLKLLFKISTLYSLLFLNIDNFLVSGIPDIFKLSAGEARSRLVSRKKDPRRDAQMSLKEKYKLVSNM